MNFKDKGRPWNGSSRIVIRLRRRVVVVESGQRMRPMLRRLVDSALADGRASVHLIDRDVLP